jgi:uncharacterized membrane protein
VRLSSFAAGLFVLAGALHFTHTGTYARIVPPYLPRHRELVWASGVAEIAGGLGLLHPRTREAAGWWLIATLLAVFPANVHMALHHEEFPEIPGGRATLLARLPFQGAFIALVRAAMRARPAG